MDVSLDEERLYTYHPLSSTNHIRLLQVHFTAETGRVEGQLIERDLKETKNDFEALSYAWGEPIFSQRLYIECYYLPVTAHLHAALYSLTQLEPRSIWIDAICINQKNLDERAVQIPLMHTIYSHAACVIVWLGESDDVLVEAFSTIPALSTSLATVYCNDDMSKRQKRVKTHRLMEASNGSAILNRLLELPWFNRLWVVQEIAAADKILFVCGSCQLKYESLKSLVRDLIVTPDSLFSKRATKGFLDFQNLTLIRDQKQGATIDFGCSEIMFLLARTRRCTCSDARDCLFALGRLVKDPTELPYLANYRKDAATVYTEFALHQAKRPSNMTMLAYCGIGRVKIMGMASWIPDWSAAPNPTFAGYPNTSKEAIYFANGHQSTVPQAGHSGGSTRYPVWVLNGAVVDKIVTVWTAPQNPDTRDLVTAFSPQSDEENITHVGHILDLLLLFLASCSTHRIPWPMLWRTLVCDRSLLNRGYVRAGSADEKVTETAINACIYRWQTYKRGIRLQKNSPGVKQAEPRYGKPLNDLQLSQGPYIRKNKTLEFESSGRARVQQELHDKGEDVKQHKSPHWKIGPHTMAFSRRLFRQFAHNRGNMKLCITSTGRLGWVPNGTIPGDVVAILPIDVPFILRPCEDGTYKVVGESYVHGIMDGEAVENRTVFDEIRLS